MGSRSSRGGKNTGTALLLPAVDCCLDHRGLDHTGRHILLQPLNKKDIYELCPTYQYVELTFWRWESACAERIPNVISQTDTVGNVVDHLALGIDATVSLRTGVLTVQVYARKPGWAFCVGCALWPARHVRIPKVIRDTLASRSTSPSVADSIAATWRGVAGIHRLWDSWWS